MAGVPSTRPPISSVRWRRLPSRLDGFKASLIIRLDSGSGVAAANVSASAAIQHRTARYVFIIPAALETNFGKTERGNEDERQGGWLVLLVQHPHGLQNYVPHDFQTLGTELVHRVLRGVVKDIAVAVIQVNEVGTGNPTAHEWQVVVVYSEGSSVEMRLVAQPRRCLQ